MPLLRVRAAAAKIQALSQNRRDHRSFSTDVLATLTLFLLVLHKPTASQAVRPRPGSQASLPRQARPCPLCFQSRKKPVPSRPARDPGAPDLVCCLKHAGPRTVRSAVQVATASWCPDTAAPSPFCLCSDICAWFHGSPLRTSTPSAGDVHL